MQGHRGVDEIASRTTPTVVDVVITAGATLRVRDVFSDVGVNGWRAPYQHALWAAVRGEVDPDHGEVNGVPLIEGMRAKGADAAWQLPDTYAPNPAAAAILTTFSAPPRVWRGVIAIVGPEDDEGITTSLTNDQLDVIAEAHRPARTPPCRRPTAPSRPA